MVDTAAITYTHADASTLDFMATDYHITWVFPNKTVSRQPNKIGITTDRNDVYRVVSCTANLSSTQLNTLNTMMMPAGAPTYDGTDPKVRVYRDGTNYFDIFCAIIDPIEATHLSADQWSVSIKFVERST